MTTPKSDSSSIYLFPTVITDRVDPKVLIDSLNIKGFEYWTHIHSTKELVDKVFEIANDRISVLKLLGYAKSAIRHNMADDIPAFKMHVCLIWGDHDKVTPPHVAEEFHKLFTNSELHWISDCGHAPMWERPDKFSQITLEWLKKYIHG